MTYTKRDTDTKENISSNCSRFDHWDPQASCRILAADAHRHRVF